MGKRARLSPTAKLKILYEGDDEDYVKFLDYIGQREHQDTIDVDTILQIIPSPHRSDAIAIAREMDEIGIATFVVGRRGSPTRLEWLFRSDSVGQVACGNRDELVSLANEDAAGDESTMDETAANAGYIVHSFRLRPEESVRFQLPSDLSQQEAGRLSDFIKSLPFD